MLQAQVLRKPRPCYQPSPLKSLGTDQRAIIQCDLREQLCEVAQATFFAAALERLNKPIPVAGNTIRIPGNYCRLDAARIYLHHLVTNTPMDAYTKVFGVPGTTATRLIDHMTLVVCYRFDVSHGHRCRVPRALLFHWHPELSN